jgi:hypothetical protein
MHHMLGIQAHRDQPLTHARVVAIMPVPVSRQWRAGGQAVETQRTKDIEIQRASYAAAQAELAKRTGRTPSWLTAIHHGKDAPDYSVLGSVGSRPRYDPRLGVHCHVVVNTSTQAIHCRLPPLLLLPSACHFAS